VELYICSPMCLFDIYRDSFTQLHWLQRNILDVWSTFGKQLAITVTVCLRSGSVNNS